MICGVMEATAIGQVAIGFITIRALECYDLEYTSQNTVRTSREEKKIILIHL